MFSRSRIVPGLLITTAAGLIGLLVWMTWRLIQQDYVLVERRLRQRLEHNADSLAASIGSHLEQTKRRLAELAELPESSVAAAAAAYGETLGEDAVLTIARPRSLEAYPPGIVPYLPVVPSPQEPDPALLQTAEKWDQGV